MSTGFHQDPNLWRTKEGQEIRINKLKSDHLENILKMLIRQAPGYKQAQVDRFYSYPEPRGDMAQLAYEGEERAMLNSESWQVLEDVCPQFEQLVREAFRRRLPLFQNEDSAEYCELYEYLEYLDLI